MTALTILMNEFLVKPQNSSMERRIRDKRDVFRLLFIVFIVLTLGVFNFFYPCDRNALFFGVTDRSNRAVTITVVRPFWSDR